ncbi:MAG TPA: Gfo/Idh/MocA family oxidoreductase [Kiritimatiellae bacterium]|nr:Gfo/Idh/MocA family oxidoreductase [Kiritimatiellia bacterium]
MSRDRTRIIAVGGGWVTNNRHLPAVLRSGLFEVLGVVSDSRERAEMTARKFGLSRFGNALDFTGWQKEAEAVVIGTTPQSHFDLAAYALQAGRHVLTEKPMTVTSEQAQRLCRMAEETGRVLAVVHNFQFSRAAERLKRRLADGRLGAVRTVYGIQLCNEKRKVPSWCDRLPLGLFYDEAPHFYYLLRWLGGPEIRLRHASVLPWDGRQTPRAVSARYCGTTGIPLYLHINFDCAITEWHLIVITDHATVDLDIWRDIYTELPDDGSHLPWQIVRTSLCGALHHFAGVVTGALRYASGRHLYGNDQIVRRFCRAIHGEHALDGMSARDGLAVVELMHELISSADRDRDCRENADPAHQ